MWSPNFSRHGGPRPDPEDSHFQGKLGRHDLKWESHTEFVTYMATTPGSDRRPATGGFGMGRHGILRRPQAPAADPTGISLALLFVSPSADFTTTMATAARLRNHPVLGCTTAGEIAGGYVEDRIVAVGFPASDFAAETIADLDRIGPAALIDRMIRARQALESARLRPMNSPI